MWCDVMWCEVVRNRVVWYGVVKEERREGERREGGEGGSSVKKRRPHQDGEGKQKLIILFNRCS